MTHRRKFGRRKSDRLVLFAAIAAVLALFWTYTQGCNKSGESPTSPAVTSTTGGSTSASTAAPAPTPTPTVVDPNAPQTPSGSDWKGYVKFDAEGNLTIFNPLTSQYDGEYCYFLNVAHPQPLLFQGKTSVPSGATKTFSRPTAAALFSELELKEVKGAAELCDIELQADAGHKSFDCDRISSNLADAGTDHLHNYAYIPVKRDPGPVVTKVTRRWLGEWSECIPRGQLTDEQAADLALEDAFDEESEDIGRCVRWRLQEITTTKSQFCGEPTTSSIQTRTRFRRCECPCIEEGPTDVPQDDVVWFEDNILPERCEEIVDPLPTGVVQSDYYGCHVTGTQTIIEDYTCQDDTRRVRELCKNVKCPCEEEWIPQEPVRENEGEWNECHAHPNGTFDLPPVEECFRERPYELVIYEKNTCTGETREASRTPMEDVEPCACEVEPGVCYYEVRGGAEGRTEEQMCLGYGGRWIRWGPHQKVQCVFPVPGILNPDFRLTPGQSDRSCLKYTGPS